MDTYILRAFSERSFLYLWIGEVFTQVSTNLFNFFLIIIVFKLTSSNTAVSGIVLSFTIPAILFGSIAGAYVDRWDKKKVLIITNVIRALLLVVLAFSLNNIVMVFIISFVFSILVQFFIPAESPMIPLVVRQKYLLAANALFGLAIFGSILIAYIISGPLLILLQPVKTALFIAIMLFIGAAFISLIKPHHHYAKPHTKEEKELNIFRDLKNTIALMSRTKEIFRSLLLLALSQILILTLATVAPGYATQVLKIPVEEFPLLFVAPAALGMVIGAIVLVNFFRHRSKEKIITVGIFLSGLALILLPFGSKIASRDFVQIINSFLPHIISITTFHIMIVLAFLLGIANSFVFVPANTILQEKTSEEFRGKIYGFLNMAIGVLSLLPIIIVGGLSDLIGVGAVITGLGISLLFIGFVQIFVN